MKSTFILGNASKIQTQKEKLIERLINEHINNNTHLTAADRNDFRKFLWAVDDLLKTGVLSVRKSYASITAMNSDTSPIDGETGKALKWGQLVIIANAANASGTDNGKIYRWLGTGNGWDLS